MRARPRAYRAEPWQHPIGARRAGGGPAGPRVSRAPAGDLSLRGSDYGIGKKRHIVQGRWPQRRPLSLRVLATRKDERVIAFISGHLDLSPDEFAEHYRPLIDAALAAGATFVVADARGADALAQAYLAERRAQAVVYHMFEAPRHNLGGFPTAGGFQSDAERDAALTRASTVDIAWVRPGRERSGTARNLARRARLGTDEATG